jgi:hypothetical protein
VRETLFLFVVATLAIASLVETGSSASASHRVPDRFAAIVNGAMPGLSPTNWPTVAIVSPQPDASEAANASSNDTRYTVTFYDFSSLAAAAAFYKAPPVAMISFLPGALGYSSLSGPTGVPGRSRGLDLRSCLGEGSGVVLYPNGRCSTGEESFSIGVGTIVQIGRVVMMVGYVRNNASTRAAPSSELGRNVKFALSGIRLLSSIGITAR